MKKFLLAILLLLPIPAHAQFNGCPAGFCAPRSAAATFQGSGDIIPNAVLSWSCSRAYNAAYANGTNPLCDLKDKTTGTVSICTLRVKTNGFVDLTGGYCVGSLTPSAACLAAAGGACVVSKIYDQTLNNAHCLQATAANMIPIAFGLLNGLPGLQPNAANSQNCSSTTSVTLGTTFTTSMVANHTAEAGFEGMYGGNPSSVSQFWHGAGAGTYLFDGVSTAMVTAADATNLTFLSLFNASASAIYVNGTPNTGLVLGGTSGTGTWALFCGNSCGAFWTGTGYEHTVWAGDKSASASALSANQRSASTGYNF